MKKITRYFAAVLLASGAAATATLPFSDQYRLAANTELAGIAALSAHLQSSKGL